MIVVGPETRTGFWLNMAGTATGTAGQTITAPIAPIGVVVLYFEARYATRRSISRCSPMRCRRPSRPCPARRSLAPPVPN